MTSDNICHIKSLGVAAVWVWFLQRWLVGCGKIECVEATTGHVTKSLDIIIGKMMNAGWVAGLARHPDGRFIIFWTKKGAKASKQIMALFNRLIS